MSRGGGPGPRPGPGEEWRLPETPLHVMGVLVGSVGLGVVVRHMDDGLQLIQVGQTVEHSNDVMAAVMESEQSPVAARPKPPVSVQRSRNRAGHWKYRKRSPLISPRKIRWSSMRSHLALIDTSHCRRNRRAAWRSRLGEAARQHRGRGAIRVDDEHLLRGIAHRALKEARTARERRRWRAGSSGCHPGSRGSSRRASRLGRPRAPGCFRRERGASETR